MLKTLPTNFKIDWKSHIKKLIFAFNNTIHKTIGFSPHFLLFGRNGSLPIDLVFDITNTKTEKNYARNVENWKKAMKEVFFIISKNVKRTQENNKNLYNKKMFGSIL